MNTGRIGGSKRELAALKAFAARQRKNGRPLIDDPRFRDRLTRVEIELMALELTNSMRFLDKMRRRPAAGRRGVDAEDPRHRDPAGADRADDAGRGPDGAALQARWTTVRSSSTYTSRLSPRYFNYRKTSIYAGSNEIQRNIIAKMTLGL
jgi:alkylation response protein AidB-like acyl-CoA dehydrogenase